MRELPLIPTRGEVCDCVVSSLETDLAAKGAVVPPVRVRRVASIREGAMGKASLILSGVPQPARKEPSGVSRTP